MLNIVALMGRLVRDPETLQTKSGDTIANFTLAVERDYKSKQTGEREADFIDCFAVGKTGEFVSRYFTKGTSVTVSGSIFTSSYTDRNGNNRKSFDIKANTVGFAGSKPADADQRAATPRPAPKPYKQPDAPVAAPEADFVVIDDSEDLPW